MQTFRLLFLLLAAWGLQAQPMWSPTVYMTDWPSQPSAAAARTKLGAPGLTNINVWQGASNIFAGPIHLDPGVALWLGTSNVFDYLSTPATAFVQTNIENQTSSGPIARNITVPQYVEDYTALRLVNPATGPGVVVANGRTHRHYTGDSGTHTFSCPGAGASTAGTGIQLPAAGTFPTGSMFSSISNTTLTGTITSTHYITVTVQTSPDNVTWTNFFQTSIRGRSSSQLIRNNGVVLPDSLAGSYARLVVTNATAASPTGSFTFTAGLVPDGGVFVAASSGGTWVADNWEFPDVRQFGAVGDGTTDDTAALKRALSHSRRGFELSAGTYPATYLTLSRSDFTIRGNGAITIYDVTQNAPLLELGYHQSATNRIENILFDGITLDALDWHSPKVVELFGVTNTTMYLKTVEPHGMQSIDRINTIGTWPMQRGLSSITVTRLSGTELSLTDAWSNKASTNSVSGNVVTVKASSHGLTDGMTIAGITWTTRTGLNATGVVLTYVDANTFTYPLTTADVPAAADTMTSLDFVASAITGGSILAIKNNKQCVNMYGPLNYVTFRDVTFQNAGSDGIYMGVGPNFGGVTITDCGPENTLVERCRFLRCSQTGMAPCSFRNLTVRDSYFNSWRVGAIDLEPLTTGSFSGARVLNNTFDLTGMDTAEEISAAVLLSSGGSATARQSGFEVIGNTFIGRQNAVDTDLAISVRLFNDALIANNIITNYTLGISATTPSTIRGNILWCGTGYIPSSTSAAISFSGSSVVEGNRIYTSPVNGLYSVGSLSTIRDNYVGQCGFGSTQNAYSLYLYGSSAGLASGNLVSGNTFSNDVSWAYHVTGIYLRGISALTSCTNNILSQNLFRGDWGNKTSPVATTRKHQVLYSTKTTLNGMFAEAPPTDLGSSQIGGSWTDTTTGIQYSFLNGLWRQLAFGTTSSLTTQSTNLTGTTDLVATIGNMSSGWAGTTANWVDLTGSWQLAIGDGTNVTGTVMLTNTPTGTLDAALRSGGRYTVVVTTPTATIPAGKQVAVLLGGTQIGVLDAAASTTFTAARSEATDQKVKFSYTGNTVGDLDVVIDTVSITPWATADILHEHSYAAAALVPSTTAGPVMAIAASGTHAANANAKAVVVLLAASTGAPEVVQNIDTTAAGAWTLTGQLHSLANQRATWQFIYNDAVGPQMFSSYNQTLTAFGFDSAGYVLFGANSDVADADTTINNSSIEIKP